MELIVGTSRPLPTPVSSCKLPAAAANEPDRCSLAATARCGRSSFLREPSSKSDPDAHADRRVSRWAPNALLMHWLVFTGTARPTSKRRR